MNPRHLPSPDFEYRTDAGKSFELFDVVGGAHASALDTLIDLHHRAFPEHRYVAERIATDARLPNLRDGIVVHQWLICIDGDAVGYSLTDSNLVRRVAPHHFLAVLPEARTHLVNGLRVGAWMFHDLHRQLLDDAGEPGFGGVAETPDYKLPIFLPVGWRALPMTYREPIHGWRWPELGLETRDVVLLWFPQPALSEAEAERLEPQAGHAAAAAFLIDTYRLDTSAPWVVELCGSECDRVAPRRDVVAGVADRGETES